jgi:YYY domain-containing protein
VSVLESLYVAVQWYIVVTVLGILAYPLIYIACSKLPDRGLSLYRSAGIAIVVLPLWWTGNLFDVPFDRPGILLSALVIGAASWAMAVYRLDIPTFLRENVRRVLTIEVLTLALFVLYTLFRAFNPHIRGTEKPMELAFLNAGISGDRLSLRDPWLAGETINYYDFGYVVLSAIAKIAGIPGEIAFNLSLATVFALAVVAAGGLAANLAELIDRTRLWAISTAGLIAGFFTGFAGNLHSVRELASDPSDALAASWWAGTGWGASRVVEDTGFPDGSVRTVITEFPAFSWILGDLHPHVIGFQWLAVGLALIVNLGCSISTDTPSNLRRVTLEAIPAGIGIGVLLGTNTWDVPIALGVAAAVLIARIGVKNLRPLLFAGIGMIAALLVVSAPFLIRYDSPTGSVNESSLPILGFSLITETIGYVAWDRSSFNELTVHWGAFLAVTSVIVVLLLLSQPRWNRERLLIVAGAVGGLVTFGFVLQSVGVVLFGIPAIALILITVWSHPDLPTRLAVSMMCIGFIAIIATEFFYIRDPFGDRMNTVFKIWFQVWLILSIATAALIPDMIKRIKSITGQSGRNSVIAVLAIVVLATAAYAPLSTYRWTEGFDRWTGIDGLDYLTHSHPEERHAIEILSENRHHIGAILEAPGCSYGSDRGISHSRVSTATGIPTVLGWDGHQYQWRRGQAELLGSIAERVEHVRAMYEHPEVVTDLFAHYGVTHVYVGFHERLGYQDCDLGGPYAFPEDDELAELGWNPVFVSRSVTVYSIDDGPDLN